MSRFFLSAFALCCVACGGAPFTVGYFQDFPDADSEAGKGAPDGPDEAGGAASDGETGGSETSIHDDAGAHDDAAPPVDAPDSPDVIGDSPVDVGDTCAPIQPTVTNFNCPVGGAPAQLEVPTYYALADGTQCSYQKTPAACTCSGEYQSSCLKAAGVCGAKTLSGSTVDGVVFVSCE
jgi:hypothetical protein